MFDFVTKSNIWRVAESVHHIPGFGYIEVMIVIVGTSLYIQRKQKQRGGDGKVAKAITILALGAILVECFMDILHRAVGILL